MCFPGGSAVKNPPGNAGDVGLIPGWEDPLEKEMAVHCQENSMDRKNLAGYGPWGHKRNRHDLATKPKPISKTGKSGAVKIEVQVSFSFPSPEGLQKGG